jgi:O-succinylbenzoic acid--CoA ligase
MDKSSLQPLVSVRPEWSIPQQRDALAAAIEGNGPALSFGESTFTSVPEKCTVVVPTSGSGGKPKSVALTSSALIASATASHKYLSASGADTWSLLLPTNHIAGINVLVRSIELGTAVGDLNSDATFTAIVPTQLHRALTTDTALLEHLQNAKAVLVGGAATSQELINRAGMAGINLVTTYGMSEMSGGCIYNGDLLEGVRIAFDGEIITLDGPMKAIGYLGEAPFGDLFFRTSDAGFMKDGKVSIIGRIDDQIISGGEKISLSAITDFLQEGSTQRFIAVGLPDDEWGEVLAIASDREIDETFIKERLRSKFGPHASPKRFLSSIELPLTSIGKPDRKKLVEFFGRMP